MKTAKIRLFVSIIVGLAAGLCVAFINGWFLAPIVAWDAAALTYSVWIWLTTMRMTAAQTKSHARREDPSRAWTDALLIAASITSLAAIALVLIEAHSSQGATEIALAGFGAFSIIISWATIHTIYALRYARMYYQEPIGGVDFNEKTDPNYNDFAYLAFTIGMTFQVSDTSLATKAFRRAALRQSLLAYLFGSVFLAATINLIAGLGK